MQLVPVAILMVAGVTGNGNGRDASLEWATHYGQAKKTAEQVQRPLLIVLRRPRFAKGKIQRRETRFQGGAKGVT